MSDEFLSEHDKIKKANRERNMSAADIADQANWALSKVRREMKVKEIVAVTMHQGETRVLPEIHVFYVEWFDTNGVLGLAPDIEAALFKGLKGAITSENRKMERSGLGNANQWRFFEGLELLAIFATDRPLALLDCWASPIDLFKRYGFDNARMG